MQWEWWTYIEITVKLKTYLSEEPLWKAFVFPASGKSVMRAWTPWEVLVIRQYYCNMSAHWTENLIRLFHGLYKSLDKLISWCLTMPEREKLRNYNAAKRNSIGHLSCFLGFFLCSARLKDPNEMSAVFCPVTLFFPLKQDVLCGTYSSLPSLFNSQYA